MIILISIKNIMLYFLVQQYLYVDLYSYFFFRRQLVKIYEANKTDTTTDTDENSIDFAKSKLLNVSIDFEVSTQVVQCLEPVSELDQNVEKSEDDNTLIINNKGLLDIDRIQEHEPKADRIVNIS